MNGVVAIVSSPLIISTLISLTVNNFYIQSNLSIDCHKYCYYLSGQVAGNFINFGPVLNTLIMQLTARLVQLLPLQSGTGKNGQWKKQDIIVETEATYPKKVCISVWGDKIETASLQPGSLLKIDFDVESREFNGRWYTDVKAWKIETAGVPAGTSSEKVMSNSGPENVNNDDDLPF